MYTAQAGAQYVENENGCQQCTMKEAEKRARLGHRGEPVMLACLAAVLFDAGHAASASHNITRSFRKERRPYLGNAFAWDASSLKSITSGPSLEGYIAIADRWRTVWSGAKSVSNFHSRSMRSRDALLEQHTHHI